MLNWIVCKIVPDKDNRPTRLEWAGLMDRIAAEITAIEIRIRVAARKKQKNTQHILEQQWEELVCLHMEFEWGLHPDNPSPASFKS